MSDSPPVGSDSLMLWADRSSNSNPSSPVLMNSSLLFRSGSSSDEPLFNNNRRNTYLNHSFIHKEETNNMDEDYLDQWMYQLKKDEKTENEKSDILKDAIDSLKTNQIQTLRESLLHELDITDWMFEKQTIQK